jgi:hypothetical protein
MAKAQLAHNNSNSGITLQLVHSAQVAYVELDNGTDLSNLQGTSDGNMDNVHTLRNQYCADFVALLEVASYTGGHGYLLGSTLGSPDWAFSLTRVQQASWTFTTVHEIGHNMGLGHHKAQNFQAGPGLYTFSAGWRWTNAGPVYNCSVMTYESGAYFADGISHTRVAHFSDPAILYGGVATGDATDGDNARNLRLIAPVVAAYRADCLTTFIGGSDNLFSNPANWSGGSVPFANAHIIIAPSATLEVDVNYTCLSLRFGAGSSFYCTGGHVLTIDGDVLNGAGDVVVDVASSLVVRSSIEILNLPPPPPD